VPLSTLAPFIGSTTYKDYYKKFESDKNKVNYKSLFTEKKELKIDMPFYGKTAYTFFHNNKKLNDP
jgi:hypothetical protein